MKQYENMMEAFVEEELQVIKEKQLYAELSAHISGEEYLRIEENLNFFHEELGKELFGRGFREGIRFLLECLSA